MHTQPDPLSTTFAALADPTRRAILARLAGGDATVTALAAPFDLSLPAVSKHLKVLAEGRPCRTEAGRRNGGPAGSSQRRSRRHRLDRPVPAHWEERSTASTTCLREVGVDDPDTKPRQQEGDADGSNENRSR